MTIISASTGRLIGISAIGRWAQAIAARFGRSARLKKMTRAEFEQMARDLDLSHPELYGLLTGRRPSAAVVEAHLTNLEVSQQRISALRTPESEDASAGMQACLPIGPSCC
ncbi:hypothetical protein [Bradyrhizobium sp. AUGA SZCCT0283]|uniref:hypothetical protein n=1 Tax=Bradyrhizobium sp. AUGA SZCCT0283 TaxID=2807671 RepID=UPI001BA8C6CC|nr:hypothetical protein [Bradyrhizobium sp. AUGA SZCCT0283]MBR1277844.1 hypothetical protein [Bradyrhizobium sp. AUGA SZCCT0283]